MALLICVVHKERNKMKNGKEIHGAVRMENTIDTIRKKKDS